MEITKFFTGSVPYLTKVVKKVKNSNVGGLAISHLHIKIGNHKIYY